MYITENKSFQCSLEGKHLPFTSLCDGNNDCGNGDDETNALCEGKFKLTATFLYD